MTPPVLRVFELRRDAARATLVREEERLQALVAERLARGPAEVPDDLAAIQDVALFLAHEAKKHREIVDLSGLIEEEAQVVEAMRVEDRDRHRRLKAVQRLLERRARAVRRTHAFRVSREIEDMMVCLRERGV
jgi:hypothetical protein